MSWPRSVTTAAERFGAKHVVFVGDRGMIKGPQMKELGDAGFNYITAITKPQIETLLVQGEIQMELFDETLNEVITHDGRRYILRRNPLRAEEMAATREDKKASVRQLAEERNTYLAEHARASVEVASRKVAKKITQLKLGGWLSVAADGRRLVLEENAEALAETSKFDGCYCLTTGHLELRPISCSLGESHSRPCLRGDAGVPAGHGACPTLARVGGDGRRGASLACQLMRSRSPVGQDAHGERNPATTCIGAETPRGCRHLASSHSPPQRGVCVHKEKARLPPQIATFQA